MLKCDPATTDFLSNSKECSQKQIIMHAKQALAFFSILTAEA